MLHPAKLDMERPYCGPSTISYLTGISTKRATEAMGLLGDEMYEDFTSSDMDNLKYILRQNGKHLTQVDLTERFPVEDYPYGPTIQRFVACREILEMTSPLMIRLEKHIFAAHGPWAVGTETNHKPTLWTQFPKVQRHVKEVYIVL